MDLITVTSGPAAESGRVHLWERHPDHPGGEIYLSGAGLWQVARTDAVIDRLRRGVLVEVEPPVMEASVDGAPALRARGRRRKDDA